MINVIYMEHFGLHTKTKHIEDTQQNDINQNKYNKEIKENINKINIDIYNIYDI